MSIPLSNHAKSLEVEISSDTSEPQLLSGVELSVIEILGSGGYSSTLWSKALKTYNDYQSEEPAYLGLVEKLRRFTGDTSEGCYKCDLYTTGSSGTFVIKGKAQTLLREVLYRRGIDIHPSASETFLGHFICLRCLVSLLTSNDPVTSMRTRQRWDPEGYYKAGCPESKNSHEPNFVI